MKPSSKYIVWALAACLAAASFSSCQALKKFFNTDLEDEDYIVGQLYADEYVKEELSHRPNDDAKPQSHGRAGSRCGMELNDKDNPKL